MMRRGTWALLDQGLFSLSTLLLLVMMAKWLPSEADYGAFVKAFNWFLLIAIFHNALLLEPVLILGSQKYRRHLPRYLGTLTLLSLSVGVVSAIVLAVIGLFYGLGDQSAVKTACGWLGLAAPLVMLTWLLRKATYASLEPHKAAVAGFGYIALMTGGLSTLHAFGAFTVPHAMLVFAMSAMVSSLYLVWTEGVRLPRGPRDPLAMQSVSDHWQFGRWYSISQLVFLLPSLMPYLLLSNEDSGALRAVANLFQPFFQANVALCSLLVPLFIRTFGTPAFHNAMRKGILLLVGMPLIAWLVLGVFHRQVIGLLYSGRFLDDAWLVWVLGLMPVIGGFTAIMHAVLSARQKPQRIFLAGLAGAIFTLTIGLGLIYAYGALGVVITMTASMLINAIVSWQLARNEIDLDGNATSHIDDELGDITPRESGQLRPLIIAFGCEPGRGSEPGTGWHFVHELSQTHEVWVITDPFNRPGLEAYLPTHRGKPIHVTYVDLPRWLAWLFETHVGINIYYYIWHLQVARVARRMHRFVSFDVVQHVSFTRCWFPTAAARLGIPFVWGPVGAAESVPKNYRPHMPWGEWVGEWVRHAMRAIMRLDPMLQHTKKYATVGLGCSPETVQWLRDLGVQRVEAMTAVAIPDDVTAPPLREPDGTLRLISIGRIYYWKGVHLAVEAIAKANDPKIKLTIIGKGEYLKHILRRAAQLGIANQIECLGNLNYAKCIEKLGEADVLIHPSIRDSAGLMAEALVQGKPVLALDSGSARVMMHEQAGKLIAPATPEAAIEEFAAALRRIQRDPSILATWREGAIQQAKAISRHSRGEQLLKIYASITRTRTLTSASSRTAIGSMKVAGA